MTGRDYFSTDPIAQHYSPAWTVMHVLLGREDHQRLLIPQPPTDSAYSTSVNECERTAKWNTSTPLGGTIAF